jgi:hypothetical protein
MLEIVRRVEVLAEHRGNGRPRRVEGTAPAHRPPRTVENRPRHGAAKDRDRDQTFLLVAQTCIAGADASCFLIKLQQGSRSDAVSAVLPL